MNRSDPAGSAPTSVKRNESQREGISSTKVSRRQDTIRAFSRRHSGLGKPGTGGWLDDGRLTC